MYLNNDEEEKWLVAGHMLRRSDIYRASIQLAGESSYFDGYPYIKAALDIAKYHVKDYGALPTKDGFLLDWGLTCQQQEGLEDTDRIRGILHSWFNRAEDDFSDSIVKNILENVHKAHAARVLQGNMTIYDDNPDEVAKAVQRASEQMGSDLFSGMTGLNPFMDLETNMAIAELHEWGVPFIDDILGGGCSIGEMVGVLMVSGGGKTTLGIQILAAHVRKKQHIVYFSTEQDLAGDMTIRMLCHALSCGRGKLKDGLSGLDADLKVLLQESRKGWETYCHFVEMAHKPIHSIDELFQYVESLKAKGIHPTSIIIDWWGRLRDALIDTNTGKMDSADLRRFSRTWLHSLRTKSSEVGVKTMVLHQLSGAVAERSSAHSPSSHSAQEDKNFNNMFDFCFTASKKDEDDECEFIADKARRGGNHRRRLRLEGEYCRFVAVGDPNDAAISSEPEGTTKTGDFILPPDAKPIEGY
jgi:KaiC/GvpD/RAD55 family RecA-like ATPase